MTQIIYAPSGPRIFWTPCGIQTSRMNGLCWPNSTRQAQDLLHRFHERAHTGNQQKREREYALHLLRDAEGCTDSFRATVNDLALAAAEDDVGCGPVNGNSQCTLMSSLFFVDFTEQQQCILGAIAHPFCDNYRIHDV